MSFLAGCCNSRATPTIRENNPSSERRGFKQPWIDDANSASPKERPSAKTAALSQARSPDPARAYAAPGREAPEVKERKVGVGIVFNAGEEGKGPDGDGLVVNSLTKGGPAEACNRVTLGDKLVSIDGVDVRGVSAGELSGIILGQPGSKVTLGCETASGGRTLFYEVLLVRGAPGEGMGTSSSRKQA